jgi:DNA (cytosine-5)-methyltransferase 1
VSNAICQRDYKGARPEANQGAPLIPVQTGGGFDVAHSLKAEGFDASEDGTGRGTPLVPTFAIQGAATRENPASGPGGVGVRSDGLAYTLEARAEVQYIAFGTKDHGADAQVDLSPTLRPVGHSGSHANAAVRRLLPIECERLQGFPDGWTDVPYRGKSAADGPRYKALGNSMAVNVMRWVGERLKTVEVAGERE